MTFNHGVPGSNPGCLIVVKDYHSKFADVAELADAPDLGSGSREWGFKSLHPQYSILCKKSMFNRLLFLNIREAVCRFLLFILHRAK